MNNILQESPSLWEEGNELIARKQFDEASLLYERIYADTSDERAQFMVAKIASIKENFEKALQLLVEISEKKQNWLEPVCEIAKIYAEKKQFAQAEKILLARYDKHKSNPELHRTIAFVLERSGQIPAAISALNAAAALDPNNLADYKRVALLARSAGNMELAANIYETIVKKHADSPNAFTNAAAANIALGNHARALELYETAYRNSERGEWVKDYAEILRETSNFPEWLRIIAELPDGVSQATQIRLALEAAQFRGLYEEVANLLRKQIDSAADLKTTDEIEEISQLRLHFDRDRMQDKVHFDHSNRVTGANEIQIVTNPVVGQNRGANRLLRVGYISADFRDHVMGRMALAMLENRDRTSHKAICYALNAKEDAFTQRFEATADGYVRCAAGTDEAIAAKIAADRLDILVDLSGPTAGSRPGVLARKPAPVQITHVGAAGPIGLSAVDYKLTDSLCDLPENQEYLIEKLLPMAGCCYPVPKYPLPTAGVTKADLELEGKVVIGAFYSYLKLSERCVRLWKRLLDDVPNAVLLFSPLDPKLKVAYENIMRAAEIPAAQFRFIPSGPTEAERLARYRVVDFVIDSMPYGGVNGTLEALYMGVPVVTLLGSHHSERTSASMMTHLGVTDTIAQSPSQYVQIARKLANEPQFRTDVSTRIRARWPKFADPTDYARRWEAVLRKVAR